MADEHRRLFQLQGFANVAITDDADGYPETITIAILDTDGRAVLPQANEVSLVFHKDQFFNKQLFQTSINGHSVQFINVLLDADEDQYTTLKQQTHSQAVWRDSPQTRPQLASKDPRRPPYKYMPNSLDEWVSAGVA